MINKLVWKLLIDSEQTFWDLFFWCFLNSLFSSQCLKYLKYFTMIFCKKAKKVPKKCITKNVSLKSYPRVESEFALLIHIITRFLFVLRIDPQGDLTDRFPLHSVTLKIVWGPEALAHIWHRSGLIFSKSPLFLEYKEATLPSGIPQFSIYIYNIYIINETCVYDPFPNIWYTAFSSCVAERDSNTLSRSKNF